MYEITSQGLKDIDQDDSGVLVALEHDPKTLEQLMGETGLPEEVLRNTLSMLITQGLVRRIAAPLTTPPPIPKPKDEGYVTLGSLSPEELRRRTPL